MSAISDAKSLAKYNNNLERENVKLQYKYNQSLAKEDRAWQEMMANSAHQREIADLKKAGLNPVLSVTGGNGSATPSGSATSVSKPNVDMSLPKAVMDMAIAQLNSATQLQTTAMNNANAMQMHILPSGNTPVGQAEYLANKLGYDTSDVMGQFVNSFNDVLNGSAKGNSLFSRRNSKLLEQIATWDVALHTARLTGDKRTSRKLQRKINLFKKWYPNVYRQYMNK